MINVSIDGKSAQMPDGLTILAALERAGVHVPHLCHDERLAPVGACRLCLVRVQGIARAVASCMTPLAEGMIIESHPPALEEQRRTLLAMQARRHPAEALADPIDNPFLREIRAYGLESALAGVAAPELIDDGHPHIRIDMSRCIDCYRCERICREVQGQDTWTVSNRGDRTLLRPDTGVALLGSSCVSCGACVDTCPTGALQDRSLFELGPPIEWTRTTCPYCGVGCEMQIGTRQGRIVDVRPAMGAPVNKGHLCSKGRYAFGFVAASDRPTAPMIRDRRAGGAWRAVSWEEATSHVAARLRDLAAAHGPDAIGVLGSARATNEENYVIQKLARVVLGTNNVDCCARVCHAPSAAALKAMLGTGAATGSFDDIERARTILVCGSNATSCHPIVGARIRQAGRRGATLIVLDPRRTELAAEADLHLAPRPGTDLVLFHAMANVILEEGLADQAFIRDRVDDLDAFRAHVARFAPEPAAAITGVGADDIRRAARLYATERPAYSVHGLGLTEHAQGTETVMALVNLALITGNVGRPGTGINPLRGQNNVQGSAHMGCEPAHLTGYVPIEDGRARFERAWGAPLPATKGLDLMEMIAAAQDGHLRALWAVGYDVYLTNPDATRTREALAALDFLVVQDLFFNETARELADVFLPAAASYEKDGTFMNGERRVQRVRRVVAPPDGPRTDWEIVCDVARALGHPVGFSFGTAEEIWNEIRAVWPAGAGISYARLESGGLQWPCPSEDHPGTTLLHGDRFAHGPRARLRCIEPRPSAEEPTPEFPFLLMTGRHLQQFNAGTMTGRTGNAVLRPHDLLDVSPGDAQRLDLADGDVVEIESRHGRTRLPVHVDDAVRPGELYATFHTPTTFTNLVTGTGVDAITHTPEYKRTAVRVGKPARSTG